MENLYIEQTKYTPRIELNLDGVFNILGKSYPENTFEFYEPVMNWVKEYFETSAKEKTIINFEISYFNSSSSKLLFDFFDLLEEYNDKNSIEVNWIYDEDNEYGLEAGEDFIEDFEELEINLTCKSE